jgi:hypothetical protein
MVTRSVPFDTFKKSKKPLQDCDIHDRSKTLAFGECAYRLTAVSRDKAQEDQNEL